jgi:hypothetical protein
MSLFESRDEQVSFVRQILGASKVVVIQCPPRLLQEGSRLAERAPLRIGEGTTMFKLVEAVRQTLLCGLDHLAIPSPGAVSGFERRRSDRRRLLPLRRRRFGRNSTRSRLW